MFKLSIVLQKLNYMKVLNLTDWPTNFVLINLPLLHNPRNSFSRKSNRGFGLALCRISQCNLSCSFPCTKKSTFGTVLFSKIDWNAACCGCPSLVLITGQAPAYLTDLPVAL